MRKFAVCEQAKRLLKLHDKYQSALDLVAMKDGKIVVAGGKTLVPIVDWQEVKG